MERSSCRHCDEKYVSEVDLFSHVILKHAESKEKQSNSVRKCEFCEENSFKNLEAFGYHIFSIHKMQGCKICDLNVVDEETVLEHLETKHPQVAMISDVKKPFCHNRISR